MTQNNNSNSSKYWKELEPTDVKFSKNFGKMKSKGGNNLNNTPVIINNFNRLETLHKLIEWLKRFGLHNYYVIDNNSTNPALLKYYQSSGVRVFTLEENCGPFALWKTKIRDLFCEDYYIYTDSDIVPVDDCPKDFLKQFYQILKSRIDIAKVGFSLKTDDLPDHCPFKKQITEFEGQFTQSDRKSPDGNYYFAQVYTTFALYKPHMGGGINLPAVRTLAPMEARHLPWYSDPKKFSAEERFYYSQIKYLTQWNNLYRKLLTDPNINPQLRFNDVFGHLYQLNVNTNDENNEWPHAEKGLTGTVFKGKFKELLQDAKKKSYRSIVIFNEKTECLEGIHGKFGEVYSEIPKDWELLYLGVEVERGDNFKLKNKAVPTSWNCVAIKYTQYNKLISICEENPGYSTLQCLVSLQDTGSVYVLPSNLVEHRAELELELGITKMINNNNGAKEILFMGVTLPGQFRHFVNHLAKQKENGELKYHLTFLGLNLDDAFLKEHPEITHYRLDHGKEINGNAMERLFEPGTDKTVSFHFIDNYRYAIEYYHHLSRLRDKEKLSPDLIICHELSGFSYFSRSVFPQSQLLLRRDIYHLPSLGTSQLPEQDLALSGVSHRQRELHSKILNIFALATSYHSDKSLCATEFERDSYPEPYRSQTEVIFDGIDTDFYTPEFRVTRNPFKNLEESKYIVFATRSLEPLRGLGQFLRAIPFVLDRYPDLKIVIVGNQTKCLYGSAPKSGKTWLQTYLDEVEIPRENMVCLEMLPINYLTDLRNRASVNVYLTYDWVLSWSLFEMMSQGCKIVASATPPVQEIMEDRVTGRLVDISAPVLIAQGIIEALENPEQFSEYGRQARERVVEKYGKVKMAKKFEELVETLGDI